MIFEFVATSILIFIATHLYHYVNTSRRKPWITETWKQFPGPPEYPVIGSGYVLMVSTEDNAYFSSKSIALLDVLLNTQASGGSALSDSNIREQIDTFLFAGHDTTKSAISWSLLYIGSHLEVQGKIHEEIDAIMGQDVDRSLELSDLAQLKYLEQCIKESMRIQPPVALVARQVTSDLTLADGTILPKGSTTISFIRGVHKDEKYYPNPDTFDPDRFSPENSLGRHPYAYLPFAAGPRNCIGKRFTMMELKIVLANIYRHFTVSAPSPNDIKPVFRIVMEPAHGIPLRFRSRWENLGNPKKTTKTV